MKKSITAFIVGHYFRSMSSKSYQNLEYGLFERKLWLHVPFSLNMLDILMESAWEILNLYVAPMCNKMLFAPVLISLVNCELEITSLVCFSLKTT